MRIINTKVITETVRKLFIEANYNIDPDVPKKLNQLLKDETSSTAKEVILSLIKNYEIAAKERIPICQDTGTAVVFLDIGQEIYFEGALLKDAVNQGVALAYQEGFLRKSIVKDPLFKRENTKTNLPAMIHTSIVTGNKLKITVVPKGGGAENMSTIKMLKPSDGIDGMEKFILEWVSEIGANPCPPIVVGVGVGGNFEQVAMLAKKSLLIPIMKSNPNKKIADLELRLLNKINKTGIGPAGLGGRSTALAVKILQEPCHIASLPVAVNIQCHALRHKSKVI